MYVHGNVAASKTQNKKKRLLVCYSHLDCIENLQTLDQQVNPQ